jgi:hypothetical protein
MTAITCSLPITVRAGEVLEYSGSSWLGGPLVVSSFTFPIIAASTVRLLAGVFTLYMAAMMAYGLLLQQHNCGNVDKCKVANNIFKTGMHGLVIALAIVSFGGHLVISAFSLVGLA